VIKGLEGVKHHVPVPGLIYPYELVLHSIHGNKEQDEVRGGAGTRPFLLPASIQYFLSDNINYVTSRWSGRLFNLPRCKRFERSPSLHDQAMEPSVLIFCRIDPRGFGHAGSTLRDSRFDRCYSHDIVRSSLQSGIVNQINSILVLAPILVRSPPSRLCALIAPAIQVRGSWMDSVGAACDTC